MGKTISEKILSSHSGVAAKAGDIVVAGVDFLMAQDGTAPLAIEAFKEMGGKEVFDGSRIALVIDHNAPSPMEGVSNLHKLMREFAKAQNCYLYDVGEGISHQLLVERGHVVPGDLVIGADSHACTYGALNVFATGVGSTDLAAAMLSGKIWLRVPETIRINLKGSLPVGVFAKDLILWLIGQLGVAGANYQAIEFGGLVISDLSIDGRLTISNMVQECGAKVGLMAVDEKAEEWVRRHSSRDFGCVFSDSDAGFVRVLEYDISGLEPQVAKPHRVDDVCAVGEVEGVAIQEAVLGTCTGGRLEDLQVAAKIVAGKRVHQEVRFIVVPASRQVLLEAMKGGILQTLIEAGGVVVAPGCGPCVGTHGGIPADGEKVISTANRNFKGRMGNPKAFIYLASAATVAAAAVAGKIVDPREYL